MSTSQFHPAPETFSPPAAFVFRLQMLGAGGEQVDEASFQEVCGLSVGGGTDTEHESGQNQFAHKLPNDIKVCTLVLKRGFLTRNNPLYLWCEQALQGGLNSPIQPATLNLQLVAPGGTASGLTPTCGSVLQSWTVFRVWPLKWEVAGFNSNDSQVVMESLELQYDFLVRQSPAS